MMDCPECKGIGGHKEKWPGFKHLVWISCWRCRETGKIDDPPVEPVKEQYNEVPVEDFTYMGYI